MRRVLEFYDKVQSMKRFTSQNELLDCFRPFERQEVELPPDLRFPLGITDYLAWAQPAGCRMYLVFEEPLTGKSLGVVFRCDQPGGEAGAGMCEWCHSVRAGD